MRGKARLVAQPQFLSAGRLETSLGGNREVVPLPPPIGSRSDPCRLHCSQAAEEEDRAMSTSSAWSGRVSPFDSSRALHVILFSVVVKEIYW